MQTAVVDPTVARQRIFSRLQPENRIAALVATARPFDPGKDVFNDVYLSHLTNTRRVQIFYGGSSSGKSVFLAQRDVTDILNGGRNFLICREVARTLRKSVFAEVMKVIDDWGLRGRFAVNKTEMTITADNGYQMLFVGLDDTEKLKSITPERGVITDVRVEEATEIGRDSLKQLIKRQRGGHEDTPKRLVLSFNPILQSHWIFDDYFSAVGWADEQTEYSDDRLSILKTWYIHNRFLTADDVYDLENEKDEYYRSVYTFGEWGVLGDVIFKNWAVADLGDMHDQFTNRRNGLDFGFSNDPAAVISTHYDTARKTIYIFNELYERGLTNDVLAVEARRIAGNDYITCDSAEPKSIRELRQHELNVLPAAKGKDSVLHGIQWLQQQTIVVDKRCINAQNELRAYQWEKDKDGNAIRRPVDRNNHIIDALRYAYERDMRFISGEARSYQG